MATYYVRKMGSDSNAGTSAAAAWATIGKAVGASGAVSGDTVYVGPGHYYEAVAVNAAAAGVTVAGDPLGQYTGDTPGEILVAPYLGPYSRSSSSPTLTSDQANMTFRNMTFLSGSSSAVFLDDGATGNTIEKCAAIVSVGNQSGISVLSPFAAMSLTIRDCYAWTPAGYAIYLRFTRGTGADYDANIQVQRCVLIGSRATRIESTGAGANFGGGADFTNCWFGNSVDSSGGSLSTTYPSTFKDCFFSNAFSASNAGEITDSGGNIVGGAYTNITQHATSRASETQLMKPFSLGHEWLYGLPMQRPFAFYPGYLATGIEGSETKDLANDRSIFDGTGVWGDSGTCTSANNDDLSDSSKTWGVNQWKGWLLRITGGTGSGQVKMIGSNTATELDISGAAPSGGLWSTTPSTDSTYIIYRGPLVETGTATSGSTTTVVDSGANWATNQWAGYTCEITAGAGVGESKAVTSNTATTLTTATFTATIDNTSVYAIYKDSLTAVRAVPGAIAAHDTAIKETSVTDAGNGIVIHGYGSHEFQIPVDADATLVTIKARYDSNHGTSTKPQAILLAQGEIGVSTETLTMTEGADTWQTLTFSSFTPTAAGVVTVRLQSRSATPYGKAYFDTFTIT